MHRRRTSARVLSHTLTTTHPTCPHQTLPNAVAAELGEERIALEHKLTGLERKDEGYVATFSTPKGEVSVEADTVVCTAPSHALGSMLTEIVPEAKTLEEIYSPPVGSVRQLDSLSPLWP